MEVHQPAVYGFQVDIPIFADGGVRAAFYLYAPCIAQQDFKNAGQRPKKCIKPTKSSVIPIHKGFKAALINRLQLLLLGKRGRHTGREAGLGGGVQRLRQQLGVVLL